MNNLPSTLKLKGISAALLVAVQIPAHAADWICSGTNDWDNPACWSTGTQPAAGDNAFIDSGSASDITVNYINTTNPLDVLGELRLDGVGGGSVILQQADNYALNAGTLFLGRNGLGEYWHSAGSSRFDWAFVGSRATGSGLYSLSGSASARFGTLILGNLGAGSYTQSGGSTQVDSTLSLGEEAGGVGSYTLSGGSLTVGDVLNRAGVENVGRWGSGSFVQEAGTVHTVYGDLFVGRKAGPLGAPSTGVYTMNGGTLVTDRLQVGVIPPVVSNVSNSFPDVHSASDGRFIQNAGNVTVNTSLIVSVSGGALGLYELRGGTLTAGSVFNNDRFVMAGGTLDSDITNRASLDFRTAGVHSITGSVSNVGQTTFTQYNSAVNPPLLVFEQTKNGIITLADGAKLSIGADLNLENPGTLDLALGPLFFNDKAGPWIDVGGSASLAGVLDISDISGWAPVDGDTWLLLQAGTGVTGVFDQVVLPTLAGWDWSVVYDVDRVLLSVSAVVGGTTVPVPAAVWLFGTGLLAVFGVGRRR
ncbi:MAG TPA: hypothetical protein ENJ79_05765 [Gammaproteobacteria bacterium]|nr:hypothetical protein [Gammaproteobacteria bacterium]